MDSKGVNASMSLLGHDIKITHYLCGMDIAGHCIDKYNIIILCPAEVSLSKTLVAVYITYIKLTDILLYCTVQFCS